jgi:hypothetical protein
MKMERGGIGGGMAAPATFLVSSRLDAKCLSHRAAVLISCLREARVGC